MNGGDSGNVDIAKMLQGQGMLPHQFTPQQQQLQQQRSQQQFAAANQFGSASGSSSPSTGLASSLNNIGSAASYQLDAANAAKQMAALQAAGRSRAQSQSAAPVSTNPTSAVSTNPQMNQHDPALASGAGFNPAVAMPMDPNIRSQILQAQQQFMNGLLQQRPPQFLSQLAEVMAQNGQPLPPALTGVPTPSYDPTTSRMRGIIPGSSVGTFHLYGKEVDLHTLLIWIIQRGGGIKTQNDDSPWESFLEHVGLSRLQPSSSPGQPPTDLVQVLKSHYALCLFPFEPHWIKFIQGRAVTHVQQHQRQQMALQQAIATSGGQSLNPNQMQTLMNNTIGSGIQSFSGAGGMNTMNLLQQQQQQHAAQIQQHARQASAQLQQGIQQQQQPQISPVVQQQQFQAPQLQNPGQMTLSHQQISTSPTASRGSSIPNPGQPMFQPNGFPNPQMQSQLQQNHSQNGMINTSSMTQNLTSAGILNGTNPLGIVTPIEEPGSPRKRKSEEYDELEGKRPRMDSANGIPPNGPWPTQPNEAPQHTMPNGLPGASLPSSPVRSTMNGTTSSSEHAPNNATSLSPTSAADPARLKIAYRPLSRPLNTYGGRNLAAVEKERAMAQSRRTVRPLDDWGEIDMEGLVLSIRSRLSVELSYALSTLVILSAFIGRDGNAGFPLERCGDLVTVLLDLLEEVAFEGMEEESPVKEDELRVDSEKAPPRSWTHQELMKAAKEDGLDMFASTGSQGVGGDGSGKLARRTPRGPDDRPEETILAVLQIFRNWSMWPPNAEILAKETRTTDVIMRICCLEGDLYTNSVSTSSAPLPLSPVLTLVGLVKVHDHAIHYLASLADHLRYRVQLPQTPPRIFRLAAAYLTSAGAAVTPSQASQQLPQRNPGILAMPPVSSDLAADLFSRFTHLDEHRRVLVRVIHKDEIMSLFDSLTRMLPVSQEDYSVMSSLQPSREPWVGYAERVMLCIYSLVFLAPPELKTRKYMNRPGIASVIMRLAKFYMRCVTPEGESFMPRYERGSQHPYMVISRRAMEALRLLDSPKDCLAEESASTSASMPTFGVGYGEPDAMGFKAGDDGVGMLAGAWQNVLEEMMFCPGVEDDFFSEIESLVRLGNVYEAPTLVAVT
ncbi:hypothetical protein FRB95_014637 [Tulasnella sp. JGI-2019a]|nr:hypothetical protein FRB95_014637 [Tulasnella sp. JGI-2019a]